MPQAAIISRDRSMVYSKVSPHRREPTRMGTSTRWGRAAANGTAARRARVGGVSQRGASCGTKAKADQGLARLWDRYLSAKEQLNTLAEEGWARTGFERRRRRLCERLVGAYSPLVKYVVNWSSSTRGSVYEDRLAWGMVGLLEAVESYDPTRGAKFETYAISKIQYAILQGFRREDPCPRRLRFFARENERVSRELTQHLGRCPTEAEMVRKMGTSVKRYRTLTEQYSRTEIASPEAWPENEHSPNDLADIVTDQGAFDPQIQTERTELQELLIEAVGALKERERLVVSLYFYEDLKLKEIGRVLELSEARISQILHRALCKLRESLTGGAWLMLAS